MTRLLLAALLTPLLAHAADLPATAEGWKEAAGRDIEAGYAMTVENHPGIWDPHNPAFRGDLKAARDFGLSLADRVSDAPSYSAAVQGFNSRIHDGHAGMIIHLDGKQVAERWPGFITAWRGDSLYVYASVAGGPAAGAKVVACDGTPIRTLIESNVFAFQGRSDEAGHWWVHAPVVFIDRNNPFVKVPVRCTFEESGKTSERTLTWRARTEQSFEWRAASQHGDPLDVGMKELRPKLFWVAMPSFQPNEKERDAYRAMIADVEANRQRYLAADAIVIDLRRNQGGSSTWSKAFASALWGEARVKRASIAYSAKTEVWWRASAANTAYVDTLADRLREQKQPAFADWAHANAEGMRAALARGDKFFIEKDATSPPPAAPQGDLPTDPPALRTPVYVVVPGQCASACLDALDVFTRFPNTRLIGAPSAADSTYMEVRIAKLDGGLASLVIPNKVYVNRPRGKGQVYFPAITVNDLVWSTENLLKHVEKDLARKKS